MTRSGDSESRLVPNDSESRFVANRGRAARWLRDEWTLDARRRGHLVVVLAIVTGVTDASGFVHLGGAFSSVMTGNLVLLGLSGGTGNAGLAGRAGAAVVAFAAGCIIGARVAGVHRQGDGEVWPRSVTRALAVELAIFAAYAVALEAVGGNPQGDILKTSLLAVNALALGLQSSAVQRFGVSGLSATYLTGTLTTTIVQLAAGRHVRHVALNLQLLGALIFGAAAGGLLAEHAMRLTPVAQLGGVGIVIFFSLLGQTQPARVAEPAGV